MSSLTHKFNTISYEKKKYLLKCLPSHLYKAGSTERLRHLLWKFEFLQAKLDETSPNDLIADLDLVLDDADLQLLKATILRSSHILLAAKSQLAAQILGRLEEDDFEIIKNEKHRLHIESLQKGEPKYFIDTDQISPTEYPPKAMLLDAMQWQGDIWLRPLSKSLMEPDGPLVRTLWGHAGEVTSVAVTPNNEVISGSTDKTIKVWDLHTGELIHTFLGHRNAIQQLRISSDGKLIISSSKDGTVKRWSLATKTEVGTFCLFNNSPSGPPDQTSALKGMAISSQRHTLVVLKDNRYVEVWDMTTGAKSVSFDYKQIAEAQNDSIMAIELTPDGRFILATTYNGYLVIWDIEQKSVLSILWGHREYTTCLAVTPDGKYAISGARDKRLLLWRLPNGQADEIAISPIDLGYYEMGFTDIAITSNGDFAITTSRDGKLHVWDLSDLGAWKTSRRIAELTGHSEWASCVNISRDGKYAVSGSCDQTVIIWDYKRHSKIKRDFDFGPTGNRDTRHLGNVCNVSFLTINDKLFGLTASSGWRANLYFWTSVNGGQSQDIDRFWGLTPDKQKAIITIQNRIDKKQMGILDLIQDPKLLNSTFLMRHHFRTIDTDYQKITDIAFTPNSQWMITASHDSALRIWDLHRAQELFVLQGHLEDVYLVRITPDGRKAVSGSEDKTIRIWDLTQGILLHTLKGHEDIISKTLTLTIDGQRVITVGDSFYGKEDCKHLRIWDIDSGNLVFSLKGDNERIILVVSSPDPTRVISTGHDLTLKIWDVYSGVLLKTLIGHESLVNRILVSSSHNMLISASLDGEIRVWDFDSGQLKYTLRGHSGEITSIETLLNQKYLVSSSLDTSIKIWDLASGAIIASFNGESGILSFDVSPDSSMFIVGEQSGRVHFLELVVSK